MSKKHYNAAEAERLYVNEQMTPENIAGRLHLCEKTVRIWKDEGRWAEKRAAYIKSRQQFHEELYEFGRLLMRSIKKDLLAGNKLDGNRVRLLISIGPSVIKVKDYEAAMEKLEGPKGKDALMTFIDAIDGGLTGADAPAAELPAAPAPDGQKPADKK